MPSWIVPSDTHNPGDSGHTTDHNHMADDLTLVNTAAPVVSGGLTGATAATRWVGATASGAPASGTFAVGDFVITQDGHIFVCTTAGSPGTWANAGAGGMSNPMTTAGDLIDGGSAGTPQRLAIGTSGQYLVVSAGAPAWGGLTGTATAYLAPAVVTLTGAATVTVNAASGNDFRLTLTSSSWTMGIPSNPVDGQRIDFQLTQDGTGSRTIAWNAVYDFGTAGAPTLTTTAARTDLLGFIYNAAASKWFCTGSALGF